MDIKQLNEFARGRTVSKIDQGDKCHIAVHFTDGTRINAYITINAADEDDDEYLSFTAKNATGWDWDETLGRQDHHSQA